MIFRKYNMKKPTLKVIVGHPWALPGEILLTYTDDYVKAEKIRWKTKRILTENWPDYPERTCHPEIVIFIKREEAEKKYIVEEVPYAGTLR